jgi:hypothetical protein
MLVSGMPCTTLSSIIWVASKVDMCCITSPVASKYDMTTLEATWKFVETEVGLRLHSCCHFTSCHLLPDLEIQAKQQQWPLLITGAFASFTFKENNSECSMQMSYLSRDPWRGSGIESNVQALSYIGSS